MDTKFLTEFGVLMIMCIVLMSGCTTEKKEGVVCNPPYILVGNECCLDQNNNRVCDNDETKETASDAEVTEKVNETIPETEKIDERDVVDSWCRNWNNYGAYFGGGTPATPNDV